MQCHLTRGITRHTESHHLSKKCHRTPSDCNFCRSACSSFRGSTISSSSCSLHCVTRLLSVWMPACCNSGGSQPRPPLRSTASNCRAQACCRPPSTKVARESRCHSLHQVARKAGAGVCPTFRLGHAFSRRVPPRAATHPRLRCCCRSGISSMMPLHSSDQAQCACPACAKSNALTLRADMTSSHGQVACRAGAYQVACSSSTHRPSLYSQDRVCTAETRLLNFETAIRERVSNTKSRKMAENG